MPDLRMFHKLSFSDVASRLDLTPFELARLMGQHEGLPAVLRFGESDVNRIFDRSGLQEWWQRGEIPVEDEVHDRALVRSLASKLLSFHRAGGHSHPR